MSHKRFFGWCPQPVPPTSRILRQSSKPVLALLTFTAVVLMVSFLLTSLFVSNQSAAVSIITPQLTTSTPNVTPTPPALIVTPIPTLSPKYSSTPLPQYSPQPASTPTPTSTQSPTISYTDLRRLSYFSEMQTYATSSGITNWTVKIHPSDLSLYYNDVVYNASFIKIYVSDVQDYNITGYNSPDVQSIIAVYVPSERIVESLSNVPHSYFSVSTCSPDIAMIVDKAGLRQIAENPCVYCIMILPVFGDEPL